MMRRKAFRITANYPITDAISGSYPGRRWKPGLWTEVFDCPEGLRLTEKCRFQIWPGLLPSAVLAGEVD
ncbi:MAG TPA: hypothetical protein VFV92_10660, partial [Candidatus Bathyarchaeia archaeon]|nr:hypothetical protein [Candidatus Bathyarchaeia archaeon]